VTIDGPAGVGKSTVSKMLAQQLSFLYLDSGSWYRAFAYLLGKSGIELHDEERMRVFLDDLQVTTVAKGGEVTLLVAGESVSRDIRGEEVGLWASAISRFPMVREKLLYVQRAAAKWGDMVAEGRDMGTVVFPEAPYKFFLEASLEARTERRYQELVERGDYGVVKENIQQGIARRDYQDAHRLVAPLRPHPEAIRIDTTHLTAREVVAVMLRVIREGRTPLNKLDI